MFHGFKSYSPWEARKKGKKKTFCPRKLRSHTWLIPLLSDCDFYEYVSGLHMEFSFLLFEPDCTFSPLTVEVTQLTQMTSSPPPSFQHGSLWSLYKWSLFRLWRTTIFTSAASFAQQGGKRRSGGWFYFTPPNFYLIGSGIARDQWIGISICSLLGSDKGCAVVGFFSII